MTDRGEIEALVRGLCAARVAGDMDVLRRGYADNATFRIAGSPTWGALTAPLTGHANVMARFESMIANVALDDFAILDLFVDGNRAAVRWRATMREAETKDQSTTEIAQFLEVEHGQVTSLVEFLDTAMAMKLLDGKKASSTGRG
jgi:ketosteroid isomerase-like protein